MKPLKRLLAACTAAVMLISLAACTGDAGADAVLRYPIDEEPSSLDPQIAAGSSAKTAVVNCFEGLVRRDENGGIVPGVAESWSFDSASSTYTFKLRSDTKWTLIKAFKSMLGDDYADTFDTRVTAHDFVFALRRALNPQTNAPDASSLYMIKNAEAVHSGSADPSSLGVFARGDFELEITLGTPVEEELFLGVLTTSICMPCNEAFFDATKGRYGLDYSTLLCNGPFYISYWTREASLTLKRSEDYRGYAAVVPASVTLFINNDPLSRLEYLENGSYCAAALNETVPSSDKLTITKSYSSVWSLSFNCGDATLGNADIRRALCYATDAGGITLNSDDLQKTYSIIPLSCTADGENLSAHTVSILGHSSEKAQASFANGLSSLGGQSVKLELLCRSEHADAMRRLIQSWQQLFGLELSVSIVELEEQELISRVNSGSFQLALAPVSAGSASAADFLLSISSQGENNIFNYRDSTFDSAVNALQSLGGVQAAEACRSAEARFLSSGAALPLFCSPSYFAVGAGVSGLYVDPSSSAASFINVRWEEQ